MNRIPMLKVLLGPDVGDAFGPLWRASHRALLRGLGLSAPVAIAAFCVAWFAGQLLRAVLP